MASLRNPNNFYIFLRSPHRPSAFYALPQAAVMITFSAFNIYSINRYNIIYNIMLLRCSDIYVNMGLLTI